VWITPVDRAEVVPDDYIELNSAGGYSSLEPVDVRIYGSGLVERETLGTIGADTFGCPLRDSDKTLYISPASAKALLERARDGGFCRLCAAYEYPGFVSDAGTEGVTLSLHGKVKSVWNHAGHPPPIFAELADKIWTLSRIESVADTTKFSPDRKAECRINATRVNH